jgi:two-component system cell cycle response regulator DivK
MTTVLYVEDNPANMRLVRRMLQADDMTMLEAPDGYTGLAIATEKKPDVILMDINLPDIDGLMVTQQIKANPELAHIPIIAVTAHAGDDRSRFFEAGCDAYLAKPVSRHELRKAITHFLTVSV